MALPRTKGFALFTIFALLLLPMIVFLIFIYVTPLNSPIRGEKNDDETNGTCCGSPALKNYIVLPVSIIGPILFWIIVAVSVSKKTPVATGNLQMSIPSAWKAIMGFGIILTIFLIIYFSIFGSGGVRTAMAQYNTKASCESAKGTWCKSCKTGSSSFIDNLLGCGCGLSHGLISFVVIGIPLLFAIIALIVVYHQKRGIPTLHTIQSRFSVSECGIPFRKAMNTNDPKYIGTVANHLKVMGCTGQANALGSKLRKLQGIALANQAPTSTSSSSSSGIL